MSCEYVVERAAANLPQSTSVTLFSVSGRVLVTSILGEVAAAIQNQFNMTKVVFNPTAGANQDLCGAQSVEDAAVGTMLTIDPASGYVTQLQRLVNCGFPGFSRPLLLASGDIELNCAASSTGQVKWRLTYTPLDPGATIVAA